MGDLAPNENSKPYSIANLEILEGFFPARASGLVMEWANLHKEELLKDWTLAEKNQQPEKIEPLK